MVEVTDRNEGRARRMDTFTEVRGQKRTYRFFRLRKTFASFRFTISRGYVMILQMKMLGIDYGDRYVGFAECDSEEILAYPLDTVRVGSMREAISVAAEIAERDGVKLIVVGLPLMPDGNEGERASKTRAFGRVLAKVTGLPVEYADERFTTVQAEGYLAEGGVKKRDMKKYTDKLSAQIILSDYMNAAKARRT